MELLLGKVMLQPEEKTENKNILFCKIDELILSVRSLRCLRSINVFCVADLIKKSKIDLMKTKNLGITCLGEIEDALAEFNLELKCEQKELL